ncbi:MAG: hypothetical protein HW384_271 [Dehalococcoidia bacterium]|nr:hypothetical protein [Dehalococcoidia bacterium]
MFVIEPSELVKALLRPEAYLHRPQKVELAQTQMSLVFMTGQLAYKVKKPVNLGYLDYTTLEKRHFFCQQEVKLNRRLCPEVYLGVAAICRQGNSLVVEGEGDVVEYAVKMLQLPQDRMMDILLENNQVTEDMVRRVATLMARFHRETETSPAISAFGGLDIIETNTEENFSQTVKYIGTAISADECETFKDFTRRFIKEQATLFNRRVEEGRIRDCHGDLHAANICFSEIPRRIGGSDGLVIYDCIEFNDRFRYCDVASEIAFLAMDLDFHGRPDLAITFAQSYIALSGDWKLGELLGFYKGYRAYTRGKVECFKSEDGLVSAADREKALKRARAYFKLAYSYIPGTKATASSNPVESTQKISRKEKRPFLLITTGLIGTGKTTLAEALAKKLNMAVISSDMTRKNLAGIPSMQHHYEEFEKGLYSIESTKRTYDALFEEADKLLTKGKSLILDASFRNAEDRRRAQQLAQARNAHFCILEITCPEEIVRKRLEQRLLQADVPSDGRLETYIVQKRKFDRVDPGLPQIRLDTSRPVGELVEHVKELLKTRKPSSTSRRRR